MINVTGDCKINERKKYSKKFKPDAISLIEDQGYTRIEAAKNLGINQAMLGRWVKRGSI
ncbi:MAG: transposase [Pseudomonadales bacterium]|nr:transposase [Pseudomonadales bacterium]